MQVAASSATPEGGQVRLSIPKNCQSGQRLRLRGKGMTKKGGRKSLCAHQIQVPHVDDPACIAAAEASNSFTRPELAMNRLRSLVGLVEHFLLDL